MRTRIIVCPSAPGTFLPILLSVVAATIYFAPLYLEGLAANWEILLFAMGIVLILLEIFVFPGHGVWLITGILFTITGLTLALVRNINFDFSFVPKGNLSQAFLMVSVAMALPLVLLLAFGQKIFDSKIFKHVSDVGEMKTSHGFSIRDKSVQNLIGEKGIAVTNLRPSGKIEINNEQYDAVTDGGFFLKGDEVKVIKVQGTYLMVAKP